MKQDSALMIYTMYDSTTNSCSFGLGPVNDLSTNSRRNNSTGTSAVHQHHHHCGSQSNSSVQVKIEECLTGSTNTRTDDWATGCAYRFAAARRCYMSSEDTGIKNGVSCVSDQSSNKVLDPGGFNGALAASFRNRYLGASAFSNLPTTPALFPGYVSNPDMNKQTLPTEGSNVLSSSNTHQQNNGPLTVESQDLPRSSPTVNSTSSSSSSSRSTHPVDSNNNKGKSSDKRVVVPAGKLLIFILQLIV